MIRTVLGLELSDHWLYRLYKYLIFKTLTELTRQNLLHVFIISCDNSSKKNQQEPVEEDSVAEVATETEAEAVNEEGNEFLGKWKRVNGRTEAKITREDNLFIVEFPKLGGQATTFVLTDGILKGSGIGGDVTYSSERDHVFMGGAEYARFK